MTKFVEVDATWLGNAIDNYVDMVFLFGALDGILKAEGIVVVAVQVDGREVLGL